MTGQTVIRAIVAGERDPQVLASYRNARVKASKDGIARALQGNWRQEHLFVLAQSLAMYDDIQRHLGECDTKLHDLMAALGPTNVEIGRAPRPGSKARVEFNQRQLLAPRSFTRLQPHAGRHCSGGVSLICFSGGVCQAAGPKKASATSVGSGWPVRRARVITCQK